jgi:hypothetical protein
MAYKTEQFEVSSNNGNPMSGLFLNSNGQENLFKL